MEKKKNPSASIEVLGVFIISVGFLSALMFGLMAYASGGNIIMPIVLAVSSALTGWLMLITARVVGLNERRNELLEYILEKLKEKEDPS